MESLVAVFMVVSVMGLSVYLANYLRQYVVSPDFFAKTWI